MATSAAPYALAVDDDPIILMDICGILEDVGFRCHSMDDGDAAKDLLPEQAENITLLFSDVEMPGDTDGFALARHVAEHWPHIEIVIASGRIKPRDGDMPQKATFIGKPFSASLVHQHLREKLTRRKETRAVEERSLTTRQLLPA